MDSAVEISMPEAARTSFALSLPWAMASALFEEAEGVEEESGGAATAVAPLGDSLMAMTYHERWMGRMKGCPIATGRVPDVDDSMLAMGDAV